jgi:hypothetical protein
MSGVNIAMQLANDHWHRSMVFFRTGNAGTRKTTFLQNLTDLIGLIRKYQQPDVPNYLF